MIKIDNAYFRTISNTFFCVSIGWINYLIKVSNRITPHWTFKCS